MSRQDQNAGNDGDQLKHALLTEVLRRLPVKPCWTYAETHAGAGAYSTTKAEGLFRAAWRAARAGDATSGGRSNPAGKAYAEVLCRWRESHAAPVSNNEVALAAEGQVERVSGSWATHQPESQCMRVAGPVLALTYPGSPILALLTGSIRGEMILSEADPESSTRLREALDWAVRLENIPIRICEGSFESHIVSLLAAPRLVLLVDPYCYLRKAPDGAHGRLGHCHLAQFKSAMEGQDAVMLVFTSRLSAHQDSVASTEDATWEALFSDMAGLDPPALRCFRAGGTPHAVLVAGWGAGVMVVEDLPGPGDWQQSWLAGPPISLRVVEETEMVP